MACDKLYWCQLKGPDPTVGVILQRNKIKVNLLSPAVGTGLSIIDQNTCISIFQSLRPQPFFNRPQAPSIRRCKENGKLICEVMVLGDMDASGRRGVVKTGELKEIPADTVIAAVGEKVPTALYEANGINVNDRGRALVNEETLETNVENVYVVGDGLGGPATVVEGIRDGLKAAQAVIGETLVRDFDAETDEAVVYERKGNLEDVREDSTEAKRCLNCAGICENCKEVCPNRANVAIKVPGLEKHQIIHVDYMCNECGNCKSFCPYDSAPYLDKFTLFMDENDMADSKNQGFTVLDKDAVHCKVRFCGEILDWTLGEETKIPEALQKVMETVCKDYTYLLR